MEPYYTDPLHDKLDDLERSVEFWRDPNALMPPMGDAEMDPLGQQLTALEQSVEWAALPPLIVAKPEPFLPPPMPPSLAGGGPRSPDPPPPAEPRATRLDSLPPPLAARPFFAHDGLTNQPYHPLMGGSTGIRGNTSAPTRWCPELSEVVEETACVSCDKWDDHGAGFEQCLHDWKEEKDRREKTEDEEWACPCAGRAAKAGKGSAMKRECAMKARRTTHGRPRQRARKLADVRGRRCENCGLPLGPVAGSLCLLCLGQSSDIGRARFDTECLGCEADDSPLPKLHPPSAVCTSTPRLQSASQLTEPCPECGSRMVRQAACVFCPACGYSPCR